MLNKPKPSVIAGILLWGVISIPTLSDTNRLLKEIKTLLEVIEKRGRK